MFDRRRFYIGLVLAFIAFCALTLMHSIKHGILFSILLILIGMIKIDKNKCGKKLLKGLYFIWFCLSGPLAVYATQLVLTQPFFSLEPKPLILGILICLILELLINVITTNLRVSVNIALVGLLILSIANYYVFKFRGSELAPSDLMSFKTAMNVVSAYRLEPEISMVKASLIICAWVFLSYALPPFKIIRGKMIRTSSFLFQSALVIVFLMNLKGGNVYHWYDTGSYYNGYILNFVLQLNEAFVEKPAGYSHETADQISSQFGETEADDQDNPDIIVIMDESFADLRKLGPNFNTSVDIMPFYDSLKENTTKGYALSSVFGGGTPNSEFEFLTGNSYAFLPYGAVPYQQYVKEDSYSIVGELHNKGYKTIGMHPYMASSWSRNVVFPYLNFDEQYYMDDFPGKDLVRSFISDQEMFDFIISLYKENVEKGVENQFYFGVTMQNHGGYEYDGDDFTSDVRLIGYDQDYPDAEQYLSLIHKTDQALRNLIEYFSSVDREVIIVFFGDHYPALDMSFYEDIHGGEFTGLDEQMLQYEIPFFVWANYETEEQYVELTSLNYLAQYMYKIGHMTAPPFIRYLSALQEKIPAINSQGYYSVKNGGFRALEDAEDDEAEQINIYSQLQYNNLLDDKNRNKILFPSYDD